MIHVSHFVGLSGIGGVQKNFSDYIKDQITINSKVIHKVYTMGSVDYQYELPINIYNIKNPINLFLLVKDVISKNKIVHFYNNLTSLKLAFFLFFLPVSNLVFHERGAIWNYSPTFNLLLRFMSWKSTLILANSNATKLMLVQKFFVNKYKIKVLHNGINTSAISSNIKKIKENSQFFHIGFIGRLDTPKGVHLLVDAMNYLTNYSIKLTIVGDGVLSKCLKDRSSHLKSISFVGRANNPYNFLNQFDLLVVPSIREPLGNVCLEAGLCKVPVLAANVDGIPEIIENNVSGELITPSKRITLKKCNNDALPLPKFVVNPILNKIQPPMQIDPEILAGKILRLSKDPRKCSMYAYHLQRKVIDYFNISRYSIELEKNYKNLINYENKEKKQISRNS